MNLSFAQYNNNSLFIYQLNSLYAASELLQLNESSTNIQCETIQYFDDFNEFLKCYKYFANKSLVSSFLEIVLIIGVIFLNFLVIFIMLSNKERLTVFDQILVGHCFVDGVTGRANFLLF
jgi:hypothetical protein